MHLIAHRGWAAGGNENSLAAFARAARDEAVTGVEFDVSRAADSGAVVLAHDSPLHTESALTLDAALSFLSRTDLELFVELKEQGLASIGDREARFQQVSRPLSGVRVCRRGAIFSVGRCAACALGRHCHVSMESGSHCAPLCTGCSLARLGRAQLELGDSHYNWHPVTPR
jgi:glycerophosphoryl diester phosphodiesterase